MQRNFTAILQKTDDGWWVANCLEVEGAITQGRTKSEALENLEDAIRMILDYRTEKLERRSSPPIETQNLSFVA